MPVLIKCGGAPGGIPAEIMPQITCSSPHLRDIIYRSGKAYLRVGFFGSCTFTLTEAVTVLVEMIGSGGTGGAGGFTLGGEGGYPGERYSAKHTLSAGTYSISIGWAGTELSNAENDLRLISKSGRAGKDGDEVSSSDLNGLDGYFDSLPHKLARDGEHGGGTGGIGYGAGGGGGYSGGYLGGAGAPGCAILLVEV